jgi:hypothetical protein
LNQQALEIRVNQIGLVQRLAHPIERGGRIGAARVHLNVAENEQ